MHGPRRVITFCLLTAVLPTVLLVIPLYLRHSLYADVAYEVTESDVLKIVDGISSIFCQEHSLKMNSTFSAYQLSGEPTMSPTKKMIHMKKSMILPDDTLEYWGFYLLNGSVMVLSACSRFDGGRVMVVRGDRNLKTCGLLDHKTKEQQVGVGVKENVRTNKVRITFENTPDSRVENNPKSAQVTPLTIKPTVNPRTTEKPVTEGEVIDIEDKVSGEELQRGTEKGEVTEEEKLEDDEKEKRVTPLEKEDGYQKEGSRNEKEDKGSREEEEELDSREMEDDDNIQGSGDDGDIQGSGDGDSEDGDSISLNQEELEMIGRFIEEQKRRGEGKARKHLRHEKKRLRELAMLGKLKEHKIEDRRKRRSVAKGSVDDGVSRYTGQKQRFARLERLKRELAEEKRREKREEVRLVDGGMKHGGTALNYTKRESEEDSDSSFEMGLKECYGGDVEFQEEFSPSDSCSEDVASEDTDPNSKEISQPSIRVEHEIRSNGYYYYIFYSDNDRVMNEVHAAFDIHKTVYEYGSGKSENSGIVCINVTECTFPVGFLSGAIVMVEIPTRDGIDRVVMDEVGGPQGALLISSCHPRMAVYIIFPVAVLFLILGCAFL